MPFIVKKLEAELVKLGDKETLILDVEKIKNETIENESSEQGKGITNKEVMQLKENLGDLSLFKDVKFQDSSSWNLLIKQIENIDEFYNIVWERTLLELMFVTQYYSLLISDPKSFEQVIIGGSNFDSWFLNSVKHNMLDKIKKFYMKTVVIYANKISLDIYESDAEEKSKEMVKKIETSHLKHVRTFLEQKWNSTKEVYTKWKQEQDKKRKSIIFD